MSIRFVLLVNNQGQTRLAQYYEYLTIEERKALEGEIRRKCFARLDSQVNFLIAAVGTGGTVTGCGEYLKGKNEQIKIVGVEPAECAVLSAIEGASEIDSQVRRKFNNI